MVACVAVLLLVLSPSHFSIRCCRRPSKRARRRRTASSIRPQCRWKVIHVQGCVASSPSRINVDRVSMETLNTEIHRLYTYVYRIHLVQTFNVFGMFFSFSSFLSLALFENVGVFVYTIYEYVISGICMPCRVCAVCLVDVSWRRNVGGGGVLVIKRPGCQFEVATCGALCGASVWSWQLCEWVTTNTTTNTAVCPDREPECAWRKCATGSRSGSMRMEEYRARVPNINGGFIHFS